MKTNEILRKQVFVIVENQIRDNNPPETKLTYERLIISGYSEYVVKQYIGQCVAIELYNIMKYKTPFDEVRYIRNLKKLPKEPFD